MDVTLFHSLWTAVLLVVFIGIVTWAWSGKRKADFDAAARMPLEDEAPSHADSGKDGGQHG